MPASVLFRHACVSSFPGGFWRCWVPPNRNRWSSYKLSYQIAASDHRSNPVSACCVTGAGLTSALGARRSLYRLEIRRPGAVACWPQLKTDLTRADNETAYTTETFIGECHLSGVVQTGGTFDRCFQVVD